MLAASSARSGIRPLRTAMAAAFSSGSSTESQRPTFRNTNKPTSNKKPVTVNPSPGRRLDCVGRSEANRNPCMLANGIPHSAARQTRSKDSQLVAAIRVRERAWGTIKWKRFIRGGYMRAVVTGGAGFLGSHLCDRLLAEGWDVLALDNFITGDESNIAHLKGNAHFQLERKDVNQPVHVTGALGYVFHFASPASPPDYLKFPIETLKVGSLGTMHSLDLAFEKNAKFL